MAMIDPLDVQDHRQLREYLSQSISSEYKIRNFTGEISQTATYVKSYIVESHAGTDQQGITDWLQAFSQVLHRRDDSLLLLFDRFNVPYFADVSDPRFVVVHTIGRTDATDDTLMRLTQGSQGGFDRAWLPTDFLYGTRRGPLRGFKFGHLAAVRGVSVDEDELEAFSEGVAVEEGEYDDECEHSDAGLTENGEEEYETSLPIPGVQGAGTVSKLSVSNTYTADSDFRLIREADVFAGRQALDTVQFVTRGENGDRINANVYATGKIIGSGTSLYLHLFIVESVRSAYGRAIESIEENLALGWVQVGDKRVFHGEPVMFIFPDGLITDLSQFAGSLFRSAKPFRLFGIPHSITEQRIDVEAIDLHTNDPVSFEITRSWMRVYLPKGSCGNIVARLYANLQHSAHSGIRLVSGSAEVLFSEGDAKDE